MSFGSEVTEDDISTFLNKFKAAGESMPIRLVHKLDVADRVDTEKKVDQLQYIGLRFEHVETVSLATAAKHEIAALDPSQGQLAGGGSDQ